ncbi:hypothetical protein FUT69_03315 [Xylella taiwanensis]|nr:hypothetical protein [Xylella taiwanensis]MCD8457447.1 hypothetical protein [Xylella taiwanensis]MCD8457605.1 hypothetical protein [Xylella taiwanensis]MCD8461271.1 hypothetical protein [Xylella taiwanensis]MCD8462695.1 hypothetical protein [Xylella taiwanensis]MCD8466482.1 hypothetical protein [Xylella taiwanensis]
MRDVFGVAMHTCYLNVLGMSQHLAGVHRDSRRVYGECIIAAVALETSRGVPDSMRTDCGTAEPVLVNR